MREALPLSLFRRRTGGEQLPDALSWLLIAKPGRKALEI
jgi:hypothetical protein